MAYVDPVYNAVTQDEAVGFPAAGVALSTITASGTFTFTGTAGAQATNTFRFPIFKTPTKVNGFKVYCLTAPTASGGVTLGFYNGTGLIGSAVVTTSGTYDVTPVALTVASNGAQTGPPLFTSTNGEMIMINTATGTASAQTLGSYSIDWLITPLFVS